MSFFLLIFILLNFFGFAISISHHAPNVHVVQPRGEVLYPTVFLIGGMAQTKASWEHHMSSLSKNRKVVVFECFGQGQTSFEQSDLQNVSLPKQAESLMEAIQDVNSNNPVDLVGFSFGARVSMAAACLDGASDCIRRMHLTGVASERSDYGRLAVEAWKDSVKHDPSLRSFAWSVLMATYSPSFLQSQPIDRYIDHICRTNSRDGLLALLQRAEVLDRNDPWHVVNMAERIKKSDIVGKLCVGELDQMAPKEHALTLCDQLGFSDTLVVPNCGHAVGIEGARAWKSDVLEFLNA
jgi:pimeloyl-ACP methyl ester carboxylesterase